MAYFFMDDFYFLSISQASSLKDFFALFKPIANIPYRPISQQLFFFSFQNIFGLKPLPFYFFILFIHFINSCLIYKISSEFVENKIKVKLISLLYFISSLHFVGLYSITGSYIVFGLFYFLFSFWFWLKFEKEKKKWFYFLSLLFFILSILSAEIGFSLPILIYLFSKVKHKLQKLIPYGLIIGLNVLINYFFAGAPETQAFSLQLGSFPAAFRWYILRAFGLPEGVKNGYLWEKRVIYTLFLFLLIILAVGLYKWYQTKKGKLLQESRLMIKYLLWIFIAALPFYLMVHHLNPIYFSVSFIGFLFLLERFLKDKLFFYYAFVSVILSFFSIGLLSHTHWTTRRAALAKEWINKLKPDCDQFNQKGKAEILVMDASLLDELKVTLQNQRALQLFCHNSKLEVVYILTNEL